MLIAGVVFASIRGSDEPKAGSATAAGSGKADRAAAGGKRSERHARDPAAQVPTVEHFSGGVPILMYHVVEAAPPGATYPDLFVAPAEFKRTITALADAGYNAVTLDQVYAAWHHGKPLARNPIVISFDDGYQSHFSVALPVLRKIGWAGVLNLKVDSATSGELEAGGVKEMIKSGWEVDSHTITHADVSTLSGAALTREIAGSRKILRRMFGVPVNFFCYPAGAYDDEAIAAVEAAGYEGAMTVEPGLAERDEPFTMHRIRIDSGDGPDGVLGKLRDAGAEPVT